MKKLTNKKGFTLMEMIIVIAIIVILAAISIPTLTGNLDSANKATDVANLRAAKSAAQVFKMNNSFVDGKTYYYNTASGQVEEKPENPAVSGKCSKHNDDYIIVNSNGSAEWSDSAAKNSCD